MKINKKLLLIPIIASIGFGTNIVFGNVNDMEKLSQESVNSNTIENRENKNLYTNVKGIISEIINFDDNKVVKVKENGEDMYFVIKENTLIIDTKENLTNNVDLLKNGDEISIYYETYQEETMTSNRQLKASIIKILEKDEIPINSIHVDSFSDCKDFDKALLSADGSLIVFISEDTNIVDVKGKKYVGSLGNKNLLVEFDIATLSIPSQTTARKVIVLGDTDKEVLEKINKCKINNIDNKKKIEKEELIQIGKNNVNERVKKEDLNKKINTIIVNGKKINDIEIKYNENQVAMIPLRVTVEALGEKVIWDSKEKSIFIGDKVSFNLSKDSYKLKGGKTVSLGISAKNFEGVNYVPSTFFTELLGLDINIENGTIILSEV